MRKRTHVIDVVSSSSSLPPSLSLSLKTPSVENAHRTTNAGSSSGLCGKADEEEVVVMEEEAREEEEEVEVEVEERRRTATAS